MPRRAGHARAFVALVLAALVGVLAVAVGEAGCAEKFGEDHLGTVPDADRDETDRPDVLASTPDAPSSPDARDAAAEAGPCDDPAIVFCATFDTGVAPWGFDGLLRDPDGGATFETSALTSISPPNAAVATVPGSASASYALLGKTVTRQQRAYRVDLDVEVDEINPDAYATIVVIGLATGRTLDLLTTNQTTELWVYDSAVDGGQTLASYRVSGPLVGAWHHVRVENDFGTGKVDVMVDAKLAAAVGPGVAAHGETTVGLQVGIYAPNIFARVRFDNVAISWR